MTRTISRKASPPQNLHSGEAVAKPTFAAVTPEDCHAAVCAGAVKYLPDLRAFARSLAGNSHQADDLVQNTILRALNAAQQYTPGTNFRAWSFTILRNIFYNQWRSQSSRVVMLDDCIAAMPVTAPTQEASLDFCDFRRAFAQLGPDQREALLLVGASGLSYSEAAVVGKCATGTMKSRVSRARSMLRSLLDGGPMNLLRHDVTPISEMDLTLALETVIAAGTLPTDHDAQAGLSVAPVGRARGA